MSALILQTIFATPVSNRVDRAQFQGAGGTRGGARWISSKPRVIAEYGPGEGVHSREIARRMQPEAQLLLFELDPAFSRDLKRQFADDPRVHVHQSGCGRVLPDELQRPGSRTAITFFPEFRSAF